MKLTGMLMATCEQNIKTNEEKAKKLFHAYKIIKDKNNPYATEIARLLAVRRKLDKIWNREFAWCKKQESK